MLRAFGALRRCSDIRSGAVGFFAMLGGLANAAIVRSKPATAAVGVSAGAGTVISVTINSPDAEG